MTSVEAVDVLIVGSGPAGMSTALHLVQADPAWARRVVIVDKAIHPREKLCGGGVTRPGEAILSHLGLSFEPQHVPVREMRLVYGDELYLIQGDPVFRVARRDEFDHWLVQVGQRRGLVVRQGEAVEDIIPGRDQVTVISQRTIFRAQVVVAADGSRSLVRQKLKWRDDLPVARLLEILTPAATEKAVFERGVAVLDFSPVKAGLQGYYWDFPSLIEGQPVMNRGIFDSRVRPERPRMPLKPSLAELLAERGHNLADYPLKGHPIRWFNRRGRFSMRRIILAGDAAGVDPLLGEGISFALGYGEVAAGAIIDAFARQDFSFGSYKQHLLAHPLLSRLPARTALARIVYRLKYPWQIYLLWRMISWLVYGFNWYRPLTLPANPGQLTRVKL